MPCPSFGSVQGIVQQLPHNSLPTSLRPHVPPPHRHPTSPLTPAPSSFSKASSAYRTFQMHCAIRAFHPASLLVLPHCFLGFPMPPSRVPPFPGREFSSSADEHPELPCFCSLLPCLFDLSCWHEERLIRYYFSVPGICTWPCLQTITGFDHIVNLQHAR